MLILFKLFSIKKWKQALLILFFSICISFFIKAVNITPDFSVFLLFNYSTSLIYLFFKSIKQTQNYEENNNPLFIIIFFIISCSFLFLFLETIFQSYISLSIFDKEHSNYFATIIVFAIQSRLISYENNRIQLFVIYLDFLFITLYLVCPLNSTILSIVIYVYSFRLFRTLTLVPYFERILKSIWRGLKISFHFVIAFFLIITVLSINSRILFSDKSYHNDFSSILHSFFNNFKISLGNGFDIAGKYDKNNFIMIYIIMLTFIMGIMFTSIFTALITDGLIKDDEFDDLEISNKNNLWYLKTENETHLQYLIKVYNKIAMV